VSRPGSPVRPTVSSIAFVCALLVAGDVLAQAPESEVEPGSPGGEEAGGEEAGASDAADAETEAPADPENADAAAGAEASTTAEADVDVSAILEAKPTTVPAPGASDAVETAPGATRCGEALHQGDHPEYKDARCFDEKFVFGNVSLHGNLELDLGYATYAYPEVVTTPTEAFTDLRGRFVFGPVLHHDFGSSGYFFEATGQFVAWVREQPSVYQINVDDVYARVGHAGDWDFQLGRFMTWRVYHKGLGFDLYTLEDNGAAVAPGRVEYGVHTYEVDYIFLRNSPYVGSEIAGRAAAHYYPARFLAFELAGAYGQADAGATNTLGGRLAADLHVSFLRASLGAEYRMQESALERRDLLPDGSTLECGNCGASTNLGFGGGIIFKYGPIEVSGSGAKGFDDANLATSGGDGVADPNPAQSGERTSFGGYLQVDPGSLLFGRSLIVGAGAHRTELVLDNFDYQEHIQGAAYVAFPLGFNEAMIKLVLSRAELEVLDATNVEGTEFIRRERSMTAARFRVSFLY